MKGVLFVVLWLFCQQLSAQSLGGSKWVLSSIDDLETGVSKDIGASVRATLQFDSDTSYSGRFCNTYQGRFRYNKDHSIKMSLPTRTKMMCMGIDKYEAEMVGLMPLTQKYRIEDESLYLFTSNHKRLTYKKDKKAG